MLTLILYYILPFSAESVASSRILAAFNMLAILPLFWAFIMDLYFLSIIISQILDSVLSIPAKKDKYYASLNKKRYEQTDTRL